MSKTWWTESQAILFVLHNRYPPCEFLDEAHRLVRGMALEGRIPTREGRGGVIELKAAVVERLCRPQSAPTSRGRPPSNDRLLAEGAASFRLDHLGGVKSQAVLERELSDWIISVGLNLSERTIRSVASNALRAHRARIAKP